MARTQSKIFNDSASIPTDELILALQNPALYDHPVTSFSVIETHISWVLLTGHYAYKIKKPVDLGFVNFSTLDKRRYNCAEELRLNRRFAPDLYLQVVSIRGNHRYPKFDGNGEVIEYAVKMREFSQSDLISRLAAEHRLQATHIDSIAGVVSNFHSGANILAPESKFSAIESTLKWSRENFDNIETTMGESELPEFFDGLKNWCLAPTDDRLSIMNERLENGFFRECHGDLHLGNIAVIDDQITLFDCIEFNPDLRWIDTISEIAFIAMDLCAHGYTGFAWRFLNHYLAATGDYEGLALLRYYFIYRAMVRAKVEALGAVQENYPDDDNQRGFNEAIHYLKLAHSWAANRRPAVIVMHGLSGSGKSILASQLAEQLGAIQIRSDIERKRLFDLNPQDNSASLLNQGIYTMDATQQTYDRLAELTGLIIKAGFSAIVDASFLKLSHRNQFKQLAEKVQAPHVIISCETPEKILRERISRRKASREDPSEASLEVLRRQIQTQDLLCTEELMDTYTVIYSEATIIHEQLQAIERRINIL